MGIPGQSEEFIYKRTASPQSEELLSELFCEDPEDRIPLPDLTKVFHFNSADPKQVQDRLYSSQGYMQGYFKFGG
jgi:hypothetical protein